MRESPMRSARRAVARASLAALLVLSAGMPAHAATQGFASQPLDPSAPAPADLVVVHQILDRWQAIAEQVIGRDANWRDIFLTQLRLMTAASLAQIDAVKINASDGAAENYARLSQSMRDAAMQAYMLAKSGRARSSSPRPSLIRSSSR